MSAIFNQCRLIRLVRHSVMIIASVSDPAVQRFNFSHPAHGDRTATSGTPRIPVVPEIFQSESQPDILHQLGIGKLCYESALPGHQSARLGCG